jgi:trypsin
MLTSIHQHTVAHDRRILLQNLTFNLVVLVNIALISGCLAAGVEDDTSSDLDPKRINQRSGAATQRIIGGNETRNGRYSYAVSLQDGEGHFCGGSLIAEDIVLTAAHCQGGSYNAVINRHDLENNNGDTIRVREEIPHPQYNNKTTNNDYMLLVLNRPTRANVELVKLNSNASVPSNNQRLRVMGWGDTNPDDNVSDLAERLMSVDVNAISNQQCRQSEGTIDGYDESYENDITNAMLCARARNRDSCQGDSGGPLVIPGNHPRGANDRQVGVVSWGLSCAHPDFPGVYARVSSQYQWIRKVVCEESSNPPASFQCGGSGGSGGSDDAGQTCAHGTANILVDLKTDHNAYETSWQLKGGGRVIGSGPPEGRNYGDDRRYVGRYSVCKGQNYTIVVNDTRGGGDGLCCGYGNGYFKVSVDGKQVAYFDEFGARARKTFFVGRR